MVYLGVDIGGTNIKMGLVENGNILKRTSLKTPRDVEELTDKIVSVMNTLMEETNVKEVCGIGIGCPGAIDSKNGIVDIAYNLGWENVHLKDILAKKTNLPIKLSNDANVAGLGETKYGAGKGHDNVIVITLGTGVGGGIILNGKLFEGNQSKGAELGHTLLIKNGRKCTCGRRGCVETYVAASRFLKEARMYARKNPDSILNQEALKREDKSVKCETVYRASEMGDKGAKRIVDRYIENLGEFLLDLCNIFRPEMIILGGGMSYSGEIFTNKINEYCKQRDYGFKHTPEVKIVLAKLENDAGLIGGACLFEE